MKFYSFFWYHNHNHLAKCRFLETKPNHKKPKKLVHGPAAWLPCERSSFKLTRKIFGEGSPCWPACAPGFI